MLRAEELRAFRSAAIDYGEAGRLKDGLRRLRQQRSPFYLTGKELEPIFAWKLRGQYGRGLALRKTNSDLAYELATRAAFGVQETDSDYDVELRLGFLTALRGVGVPVASAILALAEPDRYCVIDFRGWRAVFGQDRTGFEVKHYKLYLQVVRQLASELGWSPQETDLAIWEIDRIKKRAP